MIKSVMVSHLVCNKHEICGIMVMRVAERERERERDGKKVTSFKYQLISHL